jgi:hypothetical protein
MAEWNSTVHICHIFLIHSFAGRHLGYLHNFIIVNSATINMEMQVSLLYADLDSFVIHLT